MSTRMIDGQGQNILPDSRTQLVRIAGLLSAIAAEMAVMSATSATQKKLAQIKVDLTRLLGTLDGLGGLPADPDRMDVD